MVNMFSKITLVFVHAECFFPNCGNPNKLSSFEIDINNDAYVLPTVICSLTGQALRFKGQL